MNNAKNSSPRKPVSVYKSHGPKGIINGSAFSIKQKYEDFAREAKRIGNLVDEENFLQWAEHWRRVAQGA